MPSAPQSLVQHLLDRGDRLCIEQGRIIITAASGKPVPDWWMEENHTALLNEISTTTGITFLRHQGYSTGKYGKHLSEGATLRFSSATDPTPAFYCIFNVELSRKRQSKHGSAGSPLPKGQFRVTKNHLFYQFWLKTGLAIPPRLSSFHDYMGKLKPILFQATFTRQGRIDAKTLRPASISHEEILAEYLHHHPDKLQTMDIQYPYKNHTTLPDKHCSQTQAECGLKPDRGTGPKRYDRSNQDNAYSCHSTLVLPKSITLTTEEWLADYDRYQTH